MDMMSTMLGLACDWSIDSFLQNANTTLQRWGGYVVILLGAVMLIVGVYMIAKGLITHGKGQPVSWPIALICLILGGAFSVSGWNLVTSFADGANQTIQDLGGSTIMLNEFDW